MTYINVQKKGKNDPLKRVKCIATFSRMLLYNIEYNVTKKRLNTYVIRYTLENNGYNETIETINRKITKNNQQYIFLTCQIFMTK